jgi:hypothetical protein
MGFPTNKLPHSLKNKKINQPKSKHKFHSYKIQQSALQIPQNLLPGTP